MMRWITVFLAIGLACTAARPTPAQDAPTTADELERFASRAIDFLRGQQGETGGWGVREQGPVFPAITGLVTTGMLLDPAIDTSDPDVRRAIDFMLRYRQDDGGIYDRILPSYNTAICLSALAIARDELPEADAAIGPSVAFLRELQWGGTASVPAALATEVNTVEPSHPFYGGVGYGNSGRPDNSNLTFWLQALEDAGVPGDDPAVQRALAFLERTQMLGTVNDMPYAERSLQGGFIYATSPSGDEGELGIGESKAGVIEETLSDGTTESRLRAYGSMTYAGFKSYAYAGVKPGDPRVDAALAWIGRNYTLEENPGIGTDGYYYYLLVFGRALGATGEPTVPTADGAADWTADLAAALLDRQQPDGSVAVVDDRWMESDPVLITAYSLIAAQNARRVLADDTDNSGETP
ncbi:MAG: prenyltransferase/squalene oxidase repeat-containing protein [Planctomycetota bacterium]